MTKQQASLRSGVTENISGKMNKKKTYKKEQEAILVWSKHHHMLDGSYFNPESEYLISDSFLHYNKCLL